MTALRPKPAMPDLSQLQEGDIVLTFSGAVESWWLALCSNRDPNGNSLPYTHAEALYRDAHDRLMLGGVSDGRVQSRRLIHALPQFQHIAVYRSTQPAEKRRQAAALLEQWTHDPNIRTADFDYTLQDVPGRRDSFCCVGFLNEIYRHVGLETPFKPTDWIPNAAGRHFGELLEFNFNTIILVDSIAQHPDYEKVLEWQNEFTDSQQSDLLEKIVRRSLAWYEAGWRLKTSTEFHLGLILTDLPGSVKRIERTRSQLRLFAGDVLRMWSRLKRRGELEGLDHAQEAALLQAVYTKYRERYFYCNDSTPHAHGVSITRPAAGH